MDQGLVLEGSDPSTSSYFPCENVIRFPKSIGWVSSIFLTHPPKIRSRADVDLAWIMKSSIHALLAPFGFSINALILDLQCAHGFLSNDIHE